MTYHHLREEEDSLDVKTMAADDEASAIESLVLAFAADPVSADVVRASAVLISIGCRRT